MSDSTQEELHTGPIKTPRQLLLAVFFSFVVPVFVIIGLVSYVVYDDKPAGSTQVQNYTLGGLTAQDVTRGVSERIRKVGTVEVRDANRPLKGGQDVFNAQCASCHNAGVAGAPKVGDPAAWAARLKSGYEALLTSALKGKNAMPAQGGGDFDDVEIGRAVVYMANSAGAKFAEPQRAGAPAPAQATPVAAAAQATPAAAPATAPVVAQAPATAAPAATPAAASAGEALYKQACAVCHTAGIAGAPKLGDKAAWAPRLQAGVPMLVQSAIKGKGAMPPRGGSTASDADIRATVDYMVNASR